MEQVKAELTSLLEEQIDSHPVVGQITNTEPDDDNVTKATINGSSEEDISSLPEQKVTVPLPEMTRDQGPKQSGESWDTPSLGIGENAILKPMKINPPQLTQQKNGLIPFVKEENK